MKQFLSVFIICAGAGFLPPGAHARTMNVATGSSETEKIEVSTQTKITFSKDLCTMIVSSEGYDNPRIFEIDDIVNVTFSLDSAVDCMSSELDDLLISSSGGIVTVTGPDAIEYAVWDTAGTLVADGRGERYVSIDFTSRATGIYIIKVNNRTLKFINR